MTAAGKRWHARLRIGNKLLTDVFQAPRLDERVINHDVEGMEHHISRPRFERRALTVQLRRRAGTARNWGRGSFEVEIPNFCVWELENLFSRGCKIDQSLRDETESLA